MRRLVKSALIGIGVFTAGKSATAQASGTVGVDRLILDEIPKASASACYSGTSKTDNQASTTDSLTVAPTAGATNVQLDFTVSSISPNSSDKPMVLFLTYSTQKLSTPQIASKNTAYPFLLGSDLKMLAAYTIPPMTLQTQTATTIGQAQNDPSSKVTFTISLDMAKVNALIASSNNTLYFQAGLMTQDGLNKSDFSSLILSEVDTVKFSASCSGTSVVQAGSSGKSVASGSTTVTTNSGSKSSNTSSSTSSSKSSTTGSSSSKTSSSGSSSKSGTSSTTTSSTTSSKS